MDSIGKINIIKIVQAFSILRLSGSKKYKKSWQL